VNVLKILDHIYAAFIRNQ